MSGNDKILYSHLLIGKVPLDLKNDSVEQLSISKLSLGDINIIHDTIFVDCSFLAAYLPVVIIKTLHS